MLSRKVSMSGAMSAVVGIDRGIVGERLHAALAGLHELHLLREKQSDMVNWALRMDKDQPTSPVQTSTDCSVMGAEEERLEATLAALKQQLCRLRRQDVGLQSHLQELDQQISELKLDVSKASTEQLESDSRPSSGFYELSDGGSCSLSNSCTSVYSECLSSSSQSSLLLSPTGLAASQRPHAPPALGDLCHRSSADEGSSQAHPPRASALHLGSSRIRAGRPVSTGDLENMLTSAPGYYRPADGKKLPPCPSVRPSAGDGRFHSSLMSRGGTEVYHYPSPLHAVALHSPLFSPGGETASPRRPEVQGPPGDGVPGTDPLRGRLGYIDKILQRSVSKSSRHSEAGGGGSPEAACLSTRPHCDWRRQCMSLQASCSPSLASSQASFRYSFPAAVRELVCGEAATRDSGGQAAVLRAHPDRRYGDASAPGGSEEAPRVRDICPGHAGQMSHFVRAKFVPAGTQQVKVRQADRKTKAVRLRRRSSEKPRPPRPLQGCSSGERPRDGSGGHKEESRRSGAEKATKKLPACVAEGRGLSGPGLVHAHRVPQSGPALAESKSRRTQYLEYKEPAEHRRRRQGAGSLPGHAAVSPAATHAHRQRSREQEQGAGSRQKQACYGSSRHHQWVGQPVSRQTSMSSSFYSNLDARYPPAAPLMSYRHPASCESEYSAECASLFHSTIAESSEGEVSDNTTNHFGDSESSQSFQSFSDSDSSLSLDEGGQGRQVQGCGEEGALVWADSALRSTGMHLQPVPRGQPPTCRIKASRALKKKIRRFQPASLKVMTLV